MHPNRRRFTACAAAALAALAAPALAQNGKTLKVLVGYAPGGAADTVARAIGDGLRDSGYTVVVENKAGAAGRLAAEALLADPADGTTLLFTPLGNLTIYPHIYKSLRYDPFADFAPVAGAAGMSFALAVGASSPAKTLQDWLALAKKDGAMAAFGTPGAGTAMHFLGVMLGRRADVPLTHIPYKGGSAAVTDAVGGTLPALMTTLPNLLPMHKSGKLRILAVSSAEPVPALPGVPTFKAAGFPDLTVSESFAFFARAGTPARTIAGLNAAIGEAVKSPPVSATLQKLEFEPRVLTAAALGRQVRDEHAAWGRVVKETGYRAED